MTVRMSQELDEKRKEESLTLQRMEEAGMLICNFTAKYPSTFCLNLIHSAEGDDKTLHSKKDMDVEVEAKIEQEGEKAGMHLHVEDSKFNTPYNYTIAVSSIVLTRGCIKYDCLVQE